MKSAEISSTSLAGTAISITELKARQIIDSRGNPTIEVDVTLSDGTFSRASIPSGASTGAFEARELRDGGNKFHGKSVEKIVSNIHFKIADVILGLSPFAQEMIDDSLIKLDGTKTKENLGANALLPVSMAVLKAAANAKNMHLYEYIGGINANLLPVPLMNVINGGSHADNNLDIQEFMLIPAGFDSFSDSLRAGCEIFHSLKSLLQKKSLSTNVGDEGGFAPMLKSNHEAIDLLCNATEIAGYKINKEIFIGLDIAASEFYHDGKYHLKSENKNLSPDEMVEYVSKLQKEFAILSIEDPCDENDWQSFVALNKEVGKNCQIVGDDLLVTNIERLKNAVQLNAVNSILIKPNQIGTISETFACVNYAKENNINTIMSHRSGETEENIIADLAVGLACGQIKTGSLSRSDRLAKYNQLLRIEENLEKPTFAGNKLLRNFHR